MSYRVKIRPNSAEIIKHGKVALVMFEKKVIITDDALIVGKTKVLWENIAGLREQDDLLLAKISNRFPRAEIFLTGGKVITILKIDTFQNQSSLVINHEGNVFKSVIGIIKSKAPNTVTQSKYCFEWRLLLPVGLIEIFILLRYVFAKGSFETTAIAMISGGFLGAILGWVWERQARKQRYS